MHHFAPLPSHAPAPGLIRERLIQGLTVANALLFAVAVAASLTSDVVVAETLAGVGHWRTGERSLVVVDHTGDPGWERATKHAVDAWNAAGVPTLRLEWEQGRGPCAPDGTRIAVCAMPERVLARVGIRGMQGLTSPIPGQGDHFEAATVQVCADCGLDASRRRVVVAHELGHALGLEHSRDPDALMFTTGGSERPTPADAAALRRMYDHHDVGGGGRRDCPIGRLFEASVCM